MRPEGSGTASKGAKRKASPAQPSATSGSGKSRKVEESEEPEGEDRQGKPVKTAKQESRPGEELIRLQGHHSVSHGVSESLVYQQTMGG